jgi:hypothetical protein
LEKGTTVEKLKITMRSVFLQGRKFDFRAGNSALEPEFPPLDKISGGQKFLNFPPFEIRLSPLLCVVLQHSVKGPEILIGQNFWGPEIPEYPALRFFAKSFFSSCGATLIKGPEFLAGIFSLKISGDRNFRPQAGISALRDP